MNNYGNQNYSNQGYGNSNTNNQGNLYHKGYGRVAILSPQFTTVKVHYLRQQRKYVLCLSPQNCHCCQTGNQTQDRHGVWLWDYEEQGDRKIKVYAHMSKNLTRVFYAIQNNQGLNSCDFNFEKRVTEKGNKLTYANPQQGQPQWFTQCPDKVKAMYQEYANRDITKYLGNALSYQEQQQLMGGGNQPYQNQGQPQQGSNNATQANSNPINDFLNSGGNPPQSNNQGQGNQSNYQNNNQNYNQNQGSNQGYQQQNNYNNQNQQQPPQHKPQQKKPEAPYVPPQGDIDDIL